VPIKEWLLPQSENNKRELCHCFTSVILFTSSSLCRRFQTTFLVSGAIGGVLPATDIGNIGLEVSPSSFLVTLHKGLVTSVYVLFIY